MDDGFNRSLRIRLQDHPEFLLFAFLDEPGVKQQLIGHAVLVRRLPQQAPAIGGETQSETLRRGSADGARFQVLARPLAARFLPEMFAEEISRKGNDFIQCAVRLIAAPVIIRGNIDAHLGRDHAHRLLERQALPLHQEAEGIAALATAKALVEALGGHDIEGWRLLVVEGASRLVFLAGALELDVLAHNLDDVGASAHFFDDVLRDHRSSATVTPAPPSVGPPRRKLRMRRSPLSVSATAWRNAPVPLP